MENDTKQCGGCGSMTCKGNCGYSHSKHHTMHMILKVLLLALVFMCGFKLGMITGYIGHGYERGGMMRGGYEQYYGVDSEYYGGGMMRSYKNVPAATTTVTPTETPTKK